MKKSLSSRLAIASTLVIAISVQLPALAQEVSTINPLKIQMKKNRTDASQSVFDVRNKEFEARNRMIRGRVQIPSIEARWSKDHRLGINALRRHQYDKAEELLNKAVQEAKRRLSRRNELIETRLVLANLYLKQERFPEAYHLYSKYKGSVKKLFSENSTEMASCELGLARCLIAFGKEKQALEHCKRTLAILNKKNDTSSQLYGYGLQTLALIDANNAWYEDAKPLFNEALKIFEKEPGYKNLDLAQILREQAIFYHARGNRRLASALYERSYVIKERVVAANQTTATTAQLRFVWEPGSTRAKEIIDTEFPLRYMNAGGVRVAATVIDLWELLGVLITITNVSDHQQEFELGKPMLVKLHSSGGKIIGNEVEPVDPKRIDRIRRERVMWDLTHTRPWLANIQKTRTVRGLVPARGHDLFRGPNVFGVYRQWQAVSHIVPAKIGIMASREGLHKNGHSTDVKLPGMLREGSYNVKGHVPVFLEPFESRTGDLFYLNPRDKDVVIKIPVGNSVFEIPFHTRKSKIP